MFRTAFESGQPFAVVITDLGMPYVDGRQVAAAVKEAAGSTRVVMLTGWGQRLASRGEVPAARGSPAEQTSPNCATCAKRSAEDIR